MISMPRLRTSYCENSRLYNGIWLRIGDLASSGTPKKDAFSPAAGIERVSQLKDHYATE